jgi:hypothetical protein
MFGQAISVIRVYWCKFVVIAVDVVPYVSQLTTRPAQRK